MSGSFRLSINDSTKSDLESCPILEQIPSSRRPPPGLYISPDPCFIHTTVRDWIFDNSLESLTETFLEMGIYQHEDVVHVASGLRISTEFRQEFQNALNVDNLRWLSVQSALMRYARPVDYPFVKGSKAKLDHEGKNEYLFDQARWDQRMQLVDDERITGEQAREARQSDGASEQLENANVE